MTGSAQIFEAGVRYGRFLFFYHSLSPSWRACSLWFVVLPLISSGRTEEQKDREGRGDGRTSAAGVTVGWRAGLASIRRRQTVQYLVPNMWQCPTYPVSECVCLCFKLAFLTFCIFRRRFPLEGRLGEIEKQRNPLPFLDLSFYL